MNKYIFIFIITIALSSLSVYGQDFGAEDLAEGEADNSRCMVCHLNFAFDDFATGHAANGIGCETCHGTSDPHSADEDNITPPDKMWPLSKLNSMCMEACHPKAEMDPGLHEALFEGMAEAESEEKQVCTECHGDHRLTTRTREWNRETGELITDDAVRMLDPEERARFEED
jgi:ferredoxin